jgi:hypothetical protein
VVDWNYQLIISHLLESVLDVMPGLPVIDGTPYASIIGEHEYDFTSLIVRLLDSLIVASEHHRSSTPLHLADGRVHLLERVGHLLRHHQRQRHENQLGHVSVSAHIC